MWHHLTIKKVETHGFAPPQYYLSMLDGHARARPCTYLIAKKAVDEGGHIGDVHRPIAIHVSNSGSRVT